MGQQSNQANSRTQRVAASRLFQLDRFAIRFTVSLTFRLRQRKSHDGLWLSGGSYNMDIVNRYCGLLTAPWPWLLLRPDIE
jgi:hypothetical protein